MVNFHQQTRKGNNIDILTWTSKELLVKKHSRFDLNAELAEALKNWWGRFYVLLPGNSKTGWAVYNDFYTYWWWESCPTCPTSSPVPEKSPSGPIWLCWLACNQLKQKWWGVKDTSFLTFACKNRINKIEVSEEFSSKGNWNWYNTVWNLLNIPQDEHRKIRSKRFSNIFNLVDMPGLPPDLDAIFGKILQKKHFSEDQPPRKHWKNIKSYQRAALVPHNLQRFASK